MEMVRAGRRADHSLKCAERARESGCKEGRLEGRVPVQQLEEEVPRSYVEYQDRGAARYFDQYLTAVDGR